MNVRKTTLNKVLLFQPEVFEDHRGEYVELYNREAFSRAGLPLEFVQDDVSVSSRDVLRGIHGDRVTWKLVSCLLGRFYLVVVNCDESSAAFGKWEAFTLSERNRHQILVPPLHGLGHLALSDRIMFHYKQTTYYDPSQQFTYTWNDPRFAIWWPVKSPVLSRRDEAGRYAD
ncbi:MAG TPA: dTDP-4-dehydrorhamnose 3,5-epimerase [Thermodesulfobacteriota bacterium]|nr:dTDP-4-dehydrorhamnose 3,5-epimerase [Thermodesulfobacteriota bacterium]